jgi:hypothetical protein
MSSTNTVIVAAASENRRKLLKYSTSLAKCTVEASDYAKCIASRGDNLSKDNCLKEFNLLKSCVQNVRIKSGDFHFFPQKSEMIFLFRNNFIDTQRHRKLNNNMKNVLLLFVVVCMHTANCDENINMESNAMSSQSDLFTIIGKVNIRPEDLDLENTRILVDDGMHVGHLRSDGTFSISGLSSNTYVIEVSSPKNYFEPMRVDITSKGKVRARRLNLIQPSDIQTLRYPLNFESKGLPNYFHKREQFRILDILLSPMVLMMIVPMLLVVALPKLVSQDPELQRELNQNPLFQSNQNMPDLSEIAFNKFGGASKKSPSKPAK